MNKSNRPSYSIWLNLTLITCAVFFIVCLIGDIFGYSFCRFCWYGDFFTESYIGAASFLGTPDVRFYVFLTCFYLSTLLTYPILFCVVNIILNLKKDHVFEKINTRYMSIISICCFLICLICIVGSFATFSLVAVSMIGLFVGLIVQCVRLVMDKAIDMRDELDLTV